MDAVSRKVESQVQFWSLLGPFLLLLSIGVLLFKVSVHWYFPVSALIGIPLCLKWKMKGMAVALCTLLLFSGIGYQNLELDERYWHVGLSLAMAFSFIVMTLSLEEVQGIVAKLERESQSRLDNFILLDEKMKTAEQEWASEREQLKAETAAICLELTKTQEEKNTFHKLGQLSKEELIQVRDQHEQLLQDLHYKKQQIAQLYERLEETELSLQDFVNTDGEKQINALTAQLANLEREKEIFQAKISVLQKDAQTSQSKVAFLEEERGSLLQAKTNLQQQCEQMRHAESQQRQQLQQTQQKIHELKIKLFEEEQQREAVQLKKKELQEYVDQLESLTLQKEEQYQAALQDVVKQMNEQKTILEAQYEEQKRQALLQNTQRQQTSENEIKRLQEQIQHIQRDLLTARQNLEVQNQEFMSAQLREEKEKAALHQLHRDLQEQTVQFEEQLHQMQNHAKQISEDWKDQNQATKEELKNAKRALEVKEEALIHAYKQVDALKADLEAREQEAGQAKMQVEEILRKARQQTEPKNEAFTSSTVKFPYAPGNTRHIESMYLQLKKQFLEKCDILNETRRELFKVNEELMKLQKQEEEERVYGLPVNEKMLQRDLVQLGRQFDQMQKRYQQENDEMAELISQLLHELSQD